MELIDIAKNIEELYVEHFDPNTHIYKLETWECFINLNNVTISIPEFYYPPIL